MEFISLNLHNQAGRVPLGFIPSRLPGLKLWCRFNQGITVTGSDVDQWDDVSGNENHLKQATALDKPQKQADGSILFDGIRQFLKADAFTLVQPETIYILFKQITWVNTDRVFDGNIISGGTLQQTSATPQLRIFSGSAVGNVSLALDTYGIISSVFNSTNSVIQLDNNTPVTGDAGTNNMNGLTLGANGGNTGWSNIQVKEIFIFDADHDASIRSQAINYLAKVGGLSI